MNSFSKKIHEYITNNRDGIVAMLSSLVRIPSIAGDSTEGAMFGKDCKAALTEVEKLYREAGLETEANPEYAYMLGKCKGDEKVIGIFSHGDVVSAVEEDWVITKPFEPVEKDGYLVGRGADDNKSGVVSAIWALKALAHAGKMPQSSLLLFTGSNEECGMSDLDIFLKEHKSPDFSLVPDNAYPVCRGEKGILRFWAEFKKPFSDIISIEGGQSLNIVLGSVKCTLKRSEALLKELDELCRDKKEYQLSVNENIVITAKGRSTHAAYSDGSVNALWVLIQLLKDCKSLNEDDRKLLVDAQSLVADPFSESVGLATEDTEFKKTTCTNGIVKTENNCLTLSFDTRYGTEVDIDAFIDGYTNYLTSIDATCKVTERDDGYIIPASSPIITAMLDAWLSITGEPNDSYVSYGGTYARKLTNAVSIGTAISTTPMLDLPDGHGGAHQPDEVIDIDGLLKSIEVIAHMIIKADETLHA